MTDSIIRLTKSEEKIMKMFWKQNGEPLTSSEVVEASPDRNWKASSVHLLLNSLLNKGVIEVRGFKRTAKNYARTFQPSLSKIESRTHIIRHESFKRIRFYLLNFQNKSSFNPIFYQLFPIILLLLQSV